MTQINLVSGFLGSGKTTLLQKLIHWIGDPIALVENELGQVGIDGELLGTAIPRRDIYAGCICCSIAGDFERAVVELTQTERPKYLFVEPSGAASLSEILKVCRRLEGRPELNLSIGPAVTLVDIRSLEDYAESFGAFYTDQIRSAGILLPSFVAGVSPEALQKAYGLLKRLNPEALLYGGDWITESGEALFSLLEGADIPLWRELDGPAPRPAGALFGTVSVLDPECVAGGTLDTFLQGLGDIRFGRVLRAKGFLQTEDAGLIHFDYTPGHTAWAPADGQHPRAAVIGAGLHKERILQYFKTSEGRT